MMEACRVPHHEAILPGSPMRERRTVVNTGNRPCRDNGEGEGRLSLTHYS